MNFGILKNLTFFFSYFSGWFELLPRDGSPVHYIKSVSQLAGKSPKAFLIRTPVMGFQLVKAPGTVKHLYVRREFNPGEVLRVSHVQIDRKIVKKPKNFNWFRDLLTSRRGRNKNFAQEDSYLQCKDKNDKDVILPFLETGIFSPIGQTGSKRFDSVYEISDIVRYLDLPVYVQLVEGSPPSTPCSFTGILRLNEVFCEETIVACTLTNERNILVEFSSDSEVEFLRATNEKQFVKSNAYKKALKSCDEDVDTYITTIKVAQNFYPDNANTSRCRVLPPVPKDESGNTSTEQLNGTHITEQVNGHDTSVAIPATTEAIVEMIPEDIESVTSDDFDEFSDEDNEQDHYESIPADRTDYEGYLVPASRQNLTQQTKGNGNDTRSEEIQTDLKGANNQSGVNDGSIELDEPTIKKSPQRTNSETQTDLISLLHIYNSGSENGELFHNVPVNTVDSTSSSQSGDASSSSSSITPPEPHFVSKVYTKPDDPSADSPREDSASASSSETYFTPSRLMNNRQLNVVEEDDVEDIEDFLNENVHTPETREEVDAFLELLFDFEKLKSDETEMTKPQRGEGFRPVIAPKPKHLNTGKNGRIQPNTQRLKSTRDDISLPARTVPVQLLHNENSGIPRLQDLPPDHDYRLYDAVYDSYLQHLENGARALGEHKDLTYDTVYSTSKRYSTGGIYPKRPRHLMKQHSSPEFKLSSYDANTKHYASTPLLKGNADMTQNIYSRNLPPNYAVGQVPPNFRGDALDRSFYSMSSLRDFEHGDSDSGMDPFTRPDSAFSANSRAESIYLSCSDINWVPPNDISNLTVEEVMESLRFIGLKETVVKRFFEEQIDGLQLEDMDKDLLIEGFPELNALERKKVLDFVAGWRPRKR